MTTCWQGEMTEDSQLLLSNTHGWWAVWPNKFHSFPPWGQWWRKLWVTQLNMSLRAALIVGKFHNSGGLWASMAPMMDSKRCFCSLLQGGAELHLFVKTHTGKSGESKRKPGGAGKCYWCLTPLGLLFQTKPSHNTPRGRWHSTEWPLRWDLMG